MHSDEFDVGISYYGDDFVLTLIWTTDDGVDDEVRMAAASEWFLSKYGFDPSTHATNIKVNRLGGSEETGSE